MIEIPTARGLTILVDDDDWQLVHGLSWVAVPNTNGRFYAQARWERQRLIMHRLIMGAKRGTHVHHKNNNGLDNRKENLMVVSPALHHLEHNRGERTGVYFDKREKRFRALIRLEKHRINLGLHDSREVALRAVALARELLPGLSADEMRATAEHIKQTARRVAQ